MKAERKYVTEWKVYVGDRLFEISKTEERRNEIMEILKGYYPGMDIRAERYRHITTVWR